MAYPSLVNALVDRHAARVLNRGQNALSIRIVLSKRSVLQKRCVSYAVNARTIPWLWMGAAHVAPGRRTLHLAVSVRVSTMTVESRTFVIEQVIVGSALNVKTTRRMRLMENAHADRR